MAFPIIGDFDERNFDDEIFPPYRKLTRDVAISEYRSIRSKFEVLRRLVKETYDQLNRLEPYTSYNGRHEEYTTAAYNILNKIYKLSEEMDNLIGDIIIESKEVPHKDIDNFEWYLKRVQYEIFENIMADTSTLKDYIINNYLPLNELYEFIEGTRKALREVEKMIEEVLQYT